MTVKCWLISLHPLCFEAKNNCVTTLFVGPNTHEQQLSKKASVICQVEKPSSSEKRLQKGILGSVNNVNNVSRKQDFLLVYSRLSLNGHLYKTDTSVKQTRRVGPCLSFLHIFDSL